MPNQPSMLRTCEGCGKVFKVYAAWVRKGGGRFCGRACKNQQTIKVRNTCERCGQSFLSYPSEIRKGGGLFCSRDCWKAARHEQWLEWICAHCGSPFTRKAGEIRKTGGRFCSYSCSGQSKVKELAAVLASRATVVGDCWVWPGANAGKTGYGRVRHRGRQLPVHRVALELALGRPLRADELACHTCDTPECFRNDEPGTYEVNGRIVPRYGHLFAGTSLDNSSDRDAKGRSRNQHGPRPLTPTEGTGHY